MRRIVSAIDIGTTTISTVIAEKTKDGSIRILGIGQAPSFGMRRGAVADIDEVTSSLKRSIKEASRAANVPVTRATVSVGGTHINTFSSRGVVAISRADGEVTAEDVRRVLQAAESFVAKNPNREIVHIIPREFRIDSETGIKDPIGMVGIRLEVDALIVDGAKPPIQALYKCVEHAGVEVEDVVFAPLASAEAVLSRRQKELGVMVLDIGGGTSDFALYEEGRLIHAGVLGWGGTHITNDIAIGLKTTVDVAEAVKLRYGYALPDTLPKKDVVKLAEFIEHDATTFPQRNLAEIIEARLIDIFELAHKELKRVDKDGLLPAGVVLIGGASRIPGILDLAKRELRLPAEIGSTFSLPNKEAGLEGLLLKYPVALGLVAWHINRSIGRDPYFYGSSAAKVLTGIKNWLKIFLP